MIAGAFARGGESGTTRRAHAKKLHSEEVMYLGRLAKTRRRESLSLYFSDEDLLGIVSPHDDALVVTLAVANHNLHCILVDTGSSVDLLYWPTFEKIGIDKKRIAPVSPSRSQ